MMPPLCRLLLLLLLPTCCLCQSTSIAFSQPGNCSSSQYYNVASYACDACQTPSIQAPDGLRCTCPDTYTVQSLGSPQVTCSSCANETRKVSLDRRLCLACSSSQCSCGSGSVTEEDYINQSYRCVTCTGTTPNAAGNQCVPCQPTYKENCTCPTANQVGGLCVPDTPEFIHYSAY